MIPPRTDAVNRLETCLHRNPAIRLNPAASITALIRVACCCFMLAGPAGAQFDRSSSSATKEKVRYEFTRTDFVNGRLRMEKRGDIHVGEPLVVQIWLINHTRHPLTLKTNFIPESRLHVTVRRRGYSPRTVQGPYRPGYYPDDNHRLYPMNEVSHELVIWGDTNSPDGLVFPEPGDYIVDINLDILIPEAGMDGNLPLGHFEIRVVDTPETLEPVISELIRQDGFGKLMLQRVDDGFARSLQDLLYKGYPKSRLTPYMSFALGNYLAGRWIRIKDDPGHDEHMKQELIDRALFQLQTTLLYKSPLRDDADLALMTLFDTLKLSDQAAEYARNYINHNPRPMIGVVGNHELVKTYLVNTAELDIMKHWLLVE
jgi:hypothetical protein